MKTIYVLYSPASSLRYEEQIEEIKDTLDNQYHLEFYKTDTESDMYGLMPEITFQKCQLVISLDMAGFCALTTGNVPVIDRLPMNVIVFITQPAERFHPYLKNNMSFTTHILFESREDFDTATKRYSHIWNTGYCPSLKKELAEYLGQMEWRFESEKKS